MNKIYKPLLITGFLFLAWMTLGIFLERVFQPPKVDSSNGDRDERRLFLWSDSAIRGLAKLGLSSGSNIQPNNYVGPEACKECHKEKYESWSKHPHRWMNAKATDDTVKGDFDGLNIEFKGGTIRQYRHEKEFRIDLARDGTERTFSVTHTVGSRIFQFYTGRLLTGPEPPGHPWRTDDHVLFSAWWITRNEWIPPTGVGFGDLDGKQVDPFEKSVGENYAKDCIECHTTIPLGELTLRKWQMYGPNFADHISNRLIPHSIFGPGYLTTAHPDRFPESRGGPGPSPLAKDYLAELAASNASQIAITLGISCEACHYGCREHVNNPKSLPTFYPRSPSLFYHTPPDEKRTHLNRNLACSRCHAAERPTYAAGMPIYNSAEFNEAMAGSCYSKLACADCHDPHKPTGTTWSLSEEADDSLCLQCHQFETPQAVTAHTHHLFDSEGSRCMNCHMPRIIQGLDKATRTHAIFSPTNATMLKAGHPNACNLCHLEKTMQWTVDQLNSWYDSKLEDFPENAQSRIAPAALFWLRTASERGQDGEKFDPAVHRHTRMAAAYAVASRKQFWALPQLLEVLDVPSQVLRHIVSYNIEKMTEQRLSRWGYHFYDSPEERRAAIKAMTKWMLNEFAQEYQVGGP